MGGGTRPLYNLSTGFRAKDSGIVPRNFHFSDKEKPENYLLPRNVLGVIVPAMEPVRIFSNRPVNFQNVRRSTAFFTESLCSMHLMKNFQKRPAMVEVKICDFRRGLRKIRKKNFNGFCKNNSILRPFYVKFRFERSVLSRTKRAQNKHKKNWRAPAKLLDVLFSEFMHEAKKRS